MTMHPIQTKILRVLLFTPSARFTDLNATGITSDHFNFHIKSLCDNGFAQKEDGGSYTLTTKGKEFANRLDTDHVDVVVEKQAKIGALVCCIRERDGKKEYLVQQRLKQPFYGFHGFVTGKIKIGETVEEAAVRELEEETGLAAMLTLSGVKHKMDYDTEGNLLEDKYFFLFRGDQTKGELTEVFEGGRNIWLTKEEIFKLPNVFDGVAETLKLAEEGGIGFIETKYTVEGF